MFVKLVAFLASFSLCCSHIAAKQMDPYSYGYDGVSSTERINEAVRCMNINTQDKVDLEQIMGLWYGSEIILHTPNFPGTYEYDTCVIIHLTDVTDQVLKGNSYYGNNNRGYNYDSNYDYNNNNNNNYRGNPTTPQYADNNDYVRQSQNQNMRYMRLVWSERDNNLEYTFNYTRDRPSRWSNVGDQRGTLVNINSYTQFRGMVQVAKAVNDHLVLTFCGDDVKSSIYTVVLSRNQLGLSEDELRSIHHLLSRRNLQSETIRKVCNGAGQLGVGLFTLISLLVLALRQ